MKLSFSAGLFFLILSLSLFAQKHPIPEVHRLITVGLNQLTMQDFTGVQKTFTELDRRYPDIPLGKIFLAANLITKEFELNMGYSDAVILKYLNDASNQADLLLEDDESNVWNNYYKGLAEGFQAYFYALQNSWVKAFTTGLAAKRYFTRSLEIDPEFYDAFMAIGAYKFWKSEKTQAVSWFFSDEREEGIAMLRTAIKNRTYHCFLAAHNLVWIYIHKKEYTTAYNELEPMLKLYPDSRFFKWDLARILEEIDRPRAIMVYKEILTSYKNDLRTNRCNEITLNYLLAKNYFAIGNKTLAIECMKLIPARSQLTTLEVERLGKRLDRIETLSAEIKR